MAQKPSPEKIEYVQGKVEEATTTLEEVIENPEDKANVEIFMPVFVGGLQSATWLDICNQVPEVPLDPARRLMTKMERCLDILEERRNLEGHEVEAISNARKGLDATQTVMIEIEERRLGQS